MFELQVNNTALSINARLSVETNNVADNGQQIDITLLAHSGLSDLVVSLSYIMLVLNRNDYNK